MIQTIITALAAIFAASFAAYLTAYLSAKQSAKAEINRHRIKCLADLMGYRFALTGSGLADRDILKGFLVALNTVPILFREDDDICSSVRAIINARQDQIPQKIYKLINKISNKINIPIENLTEIDFLKTMVIK